MLKTAILKIISYLFGSRKVNKAQTKNESAESDWLELPIKTDAIGDTDDKNSNQITKKDKKTKNKKQGKNLKRIKKFEKKSEEKSLKKPEQKPEQKLVKKSEQQHDSEEEGLEIFCLDLTNLAREGSIDEAYGRQEEVDLLMQILMRHQKNNALIIGEAGVGKSTLVEALAYKIANNLVPFSLSKKRIIELQVGSILTGTKYRGVLEEKLENLVDYIRSNPDNIVFVDEFHIVMGGIHPDGENMNISSILKPALSRSTIQVIGATTAQEYNELEKDPALKRRFQNIELTQPSQPETFEILKRIMPKYESFHKIVYSDEALSTAIDLTDRFVGDKVFPDKAIDILDLVAAKKSVKNMYATKENIAQPITSRILRNIIKLQAECTKTNNFALHFLLLEIERAYTEFQKRMAAGDSIDFSTNKFLTSNASRALHKVLGDNIEKFLFPEFCQEDTESSTAITYSKVNRLESLNPEESSVVYNYLHDERTSGKNGTNNSTFLLTSKITTTLLLFVKWLSIVNKNPSKYESFNFPIEEPYHICIHTRIADLFDDFKMNQFISGIVQITNVLLTKKIQILAIRKAKAKINKLDDKSNFSSQTEEISHLITKIKPVFKDKAIILLNPESNLADLKFSKDDSDVIFEFLTSLFRSPDIEDTYNKDSKRDRTSYLISADDVTDAISSLKGIPLQNVKNEDSSFLKNIETSLHGRVIGQYEAVNAIGRAIKRARVGVSSKKRPIGSFLFCGPTGVGKTEIAKALAEKIFFSEQNLIRFDMSEYHDAHTVSRLIGAPPGYIGSEEGGKLSNEVRNKPYSVVLFDEIEKAHKSVLTILLQILDDGIVTDNKGHTVSFKNTVIVITSNVGARKILDFTKNQFEGSQDYFVYEDDSDKERDFEKEFDELMKKPVTGTLMEDMRKIIVAQYARARLPKKSIEQASINGNSATYIALKELVFKELQKEFLPEWLNRFDDIIVFTPLTKNEISQICNLMIKNVCAQLKANGINLTVTPDVKKVLVERGYDPQFGARPLRREISNSIESFVAEYLLEFPSKSLEIFLSIDGQLTITST